MARPGVAYDLVAEIADSLLRQGVEPAAKAIRDELARRAKPGAPTGSPNTIQRHLNVWRAARPISLTAPGVLPSQLAGDLARALTAAADVARETAERNLAQLQREQDELIAAGEANEARLDQVSQDLEARTSQRDELRGQLIERAEEVGRLQLEVSLAREAAQVTGSALSAAHAAEQAASGRLDELRQSADRERAQLLAELGDTRAGQAAAVQRAHTAEQRAAAAEARLEGALDTKSTLAAQVLELRETVKRLEAAALRTAAAEGAVEALQEQNTLLTQTNAMLQSLVKVAGGMGG